MIKAIIYGSNGKMAQVVSKQIEKRYRSCSGNR